MVSLAEIGVIQLTDQQRDDRPELRAEITVTDSAQRKDKLRVVPKTQKAQEQTFVQTVESPSEDIGDERKDSRSVRQEEESPAPQTKGKETSKQETVQRYKAADRRQPEEHLLTVIPDSDKHSRPEERQDIIVSQTAVRETDRTEEDRRDEPQLQPAASSKKTAEKVSVRKPAEKKVSAVSSEVEQESGTDVKLRTESGTDVKLRTATHDESIYVPDALIPDKVQGKEKKWTPPPTAPSRGNTTICTFLFLLQPSGPSCLSSCYHQASVTCLLFFFCDVNQGHM